MSTVCDICDYQIRQELTVIPNVPSHTYNCYVEPVDLEIADCPHCGAVFLVGPPPSEDWDVVYRSLRVSAQARERKKAALRWFIDKYVLHDLEIIELGCGDGQILDLLREIGERNIMGIEAGVDNMIECAKKGHRVRSGHFPEIPQANALICSYHLEHYPHPTWIMHRIHDMLRPGGVAYIEVPNYDWIEQHGIWKELTRDHRFYFTSRSLEKVITKCGLYVESQYYDDPLCLAVVARRRKAPGLGQVTRRPENGVAYLAERMEEDVLQFMALTKDIGAYAVYGAGHYAQSMLHQIYHRNGNMPTAIFDANPDKIGGHICFIQVKAADLDEIGKHKRVIVMCGAYNDEVMETLSGLCNEVIRWD